MSVFFLIKKINVRNANAMGSAYTAGFPAMTAWLGGVHAIERKLKTPGIKFTSVAIVSHNFEMQTHKCETEKYARIKNSLFTPENKNGKFKNASIVEQATCHATISLLVETEGVDDKDKADSLEHEIKEILMENRLAGGNVTHVESVKAIFHDSDDDDRKVLRKLMPGFALIERRDLLKGESPMEKLIDTLSVNATYDEKKGWQYERKESGWIVPIAVGFKALSGFVAAKNSRAPDVKHRFVEPVVTLCEFKMPHRFNKIEDITWRYSVDEEKGLYLCVNQK